MVRPPLAPLVLLALLAGCVAPAATEEPAPEEPADAQEARASPADASAPAPAPANGTLVVLARRPDQTLLAGANVTVADQSRLTGADGLARFPDLAPGRVLVEARKEAHRTAQAEAEVVAGQETRVEVVLAAETGDQHAHEEGLFAHRDLYVFQGHFDCSLTYVIVTGDCALLVDNVTGQGGLGTPAGDQTQERHLIDFPLDRGWASLVVEMEWSANASTPATGGDMQLALEPAEAPADGHAVKYARVVGPSPLRIEMAPGVQHATATAEGDMPNPQGGEVIRSRVFVTGAGHNAGGAGFLGVGAAHNQDFRLYVSIFYEEPAPEGYTALGGGA